MTSIYLKGGYFFWIPVAHIISATIRGNKSIIDLWWQTFVYKLGDWKTLKRSQTLATLNNNYSIINSRKHDINKVICVFNYFIHVRDTTVHRAIVFQLLLVFITPKLYAQLNCRNYFTETKMFTWFENIEFNCGECFFSKSILVHRDYERPSTKPSPLNKGHTTVGIYESYNRQIYFIHLLFSCLLMVILFCKLPEKNFIIKSNYNFFILNNLLRFLCLVCWRLLYIRTDITTRTIIIITATHTGTMT